MAVTAVEVVYRGIFQKTLSRNICRSIVLAARKENKIGTAFGRYGDSPERNGIPAKYFAVVADDADELQESLAQYEPKAVDVTIVVDDTLCKGVESWAWYGLQPINELTKEGATVLVTSIQKPQELLEDIHVKDVPYDLAIVKSPKSFSGLWVYKDDHTDVRILGALAKVCPQLVGLDAYKQTIADQWDDDLKVGSAERSHDRVKVTPIEPGPGQHRSAIHLRHARLDRDERGACAACHRGGRRVPRRGRRVRAGAQRGVQEVVNPHHAARGELRDLHQVHPLLAPVPGLLLRRDPRGPVRLRHGVVLRLRRMRGRLPGPGLRDHGARVGL